LTALTLTYILCMYWHDRRHMRQCRLCGLRTHS